MKNGNDLIKVFIVDDHAVVVEGIYALLQNEENISVVGFAYSATNCIHFFSHKTADVILMDINMPDMNGIDLCKEIKETHPSVMILALSTFDQGSYIRKMMENGANGYLLKNAGKQEIVDAIKLAATGKTYLSFSASQSLKVDQQRMKSIPHLTKREKEVLVLIVDGLTNIQIAEKLYISADTVDSHRKKLYLKLNVNNTASLVRFAIENELLQ